MDASHGFNDMSMHPPVYAALASSHGMVLLTVGGHVQVHPSIDPMIAAAAVTQQEAVIQFEGESILAPIDQIDPSTVELACNEEGCCLIPNDGNPHNDIILQPYTVLCNDSGCYVDYGTGSHDHMSHQDEYSHRVVP